MWASEAQPPQEARSGIRRVLIFIVPWPLPGHQSPDKAVSSVLTSASEAAASKGPCQAALLTPTTSGCPAEKVSPTQRTPALENEVLWQGNTSLSLWKLLLSSVSPEMLDAAACCGWRLYHRQVDRAELGLWHILSSGCFSLETSSFSNENLQ